MLCAKSLKNNKSKERRMRNGLLGFAVVTSVCFVFACGNLGPTGGHRAQFIVTLTSLSPSSVVAGGPPFILTVNGSNLTGGYATLIWNGGQHISSVGAGQSPESTQATFQIDASLIANPGNISIAVVDGINANQVSNALTLTIMPHTTTACALFGIYDFLFTSFDGSAVAGAFGVDASGNVSGEEDFSGFIGSTPYSISGTCTNSATPNQGTLTITPFSAAASTYTFVLQQGSGLPRGRLVGDTSSSSSTMPGSGVFVETAPDSVLQNGDYAFGLLGEDPYGDSGVGTQIAVPGRFTYANGNLSNGVSDINDGGIVTASAPLSGAKVPIPADIWPRMMLNLSVGGTSTGFAVYTNSSGSAFAIGAVATPFPHTSGPGVANIAGFIFPQAKAGMYDNASLNAPVVFSTWGAPPPLCCPNTNPSVTDTTIGLASTFDSNAGTFNLAFDNVSQGVANLNQVVTGATYNVASNGRATVSYSVGQNAVNYVYYLDNANDGFILGLGNTAEFGFFQVQSSGPFSTASINGTFASATFLALLPSSPNLAAEVTLNNGNLSANTPGGALTGTYSVAASGRGTATVNLPLLGGEDWVFYVVGPDSVLVMGSDNATSDAIMSMHQ